MRATNFTHDNKIPELGVPGKSRRPHPVPPPDPEPVVTTEETGEAWGE